MRHMLNTMDEMDMEKEGMQEKATYESLNESFLKMQKLAGVITEGQYRKKVQMLNEVEYAGIKKVPTSGDNYQLTIDAEKWSGQKGGGDHIIAFTKNSTFYLGQGSWDWEKEPKAGEVKNLLKKYVEENNIENLSYDTKKFLGLNENFIKETKIPSFRIKQVLTPFGMDKPEIQADLRVGLNYVIPKKNYSDMNDVQQHMGKVTKIEGDKVFLETSKGEQQYKISDLVYISNAAA